MIADTSLPMLQPKIRTAVIDGKTEDLLNADALIAICSTGETPEARTVYSAFRRHYAELCMREPDTDDQVRREKAIASALASIGVRIERVGQ